MRGLKARFKPTTVANKVLVIKSLFSFAVKTGYLSLNVGSFLKTPKAKENLADQILDISQVQGLIKYGVKNDRDRLMLLLMYGCGLRVSEVVGLTWNDLKPHHKGEGKCTVFGKGSKTRVVIIPDWLWAKLKEFEKYHRVNQYFFISRNHNKMNRSVVHQMITKHIAQVTMTPEEQVIVQQKLKEIASILYKNTPSEELETFETVELSVRKHLLETVAPEIGEFFLAKQGAKKQEESDR